MLLLDRLEHDMDNDADGRKGPLNYKDACKLHQCCGMFLHYLQKLEALAPSKDFPSMRSGLIDQFKHSYMDADLLHSLEHSVPPGDLTAVGSFRRPLGPLLCQK